MSQVVSDEKSRYARLCALGLMALGIALRFAGYFANRSLWGDEIAIALNIRLRDLASLRYPLDYEQTMPIPLLVGIKSVVSVFGPSEYILRLLPLVVGCCTLPLLWFVYRRLFGSSIALASLAFASIYRPLIYYSSEVKQYGLDALVTTITLWLGFEVLQTGQARDWWRLIAWGAMGLWLSQPAVFVLAAVGLAAVLDQRFRTLTRWRAYCIIAAAAWMAVFGLLYFVSYRAVSHSAYMRAFWSSRFLNPGSPGFLRQLVDAIYVVLGAEYFDHVRAILLGALFVVGLYGIWQRHYRNGIVVAISPFIGLFIAASLGQYPIATRLVLFTFPLVIWVYATAIVTLSDLVRPKLRPTATAFLLLGLLAPTAVGSVKYASHFPQREASRQIVAWMKATDSSAPVYIAFDEYLQWVYYAGDWSHPEALKVRLAQAFHSARRTEFFRVAESQETEEIVGQFPPEASEGVERDLQWARNEAAAILALKQAHVWLFLPIYIDNPVMGHTFKQRKLFERLQEELNRGGARLANTYSIGDGVALRYDLPPSATS